MSEDELRRLLRVPLQAYGEVAAPMSPIAALPHASPVMLRVKRLSTERELTTVRISLSTTRDIADFLQFLHGRYLEVAPRQDRRSWSEPPEWDWRGREFRRMLRTWTPRTWMDVAVHPANLSFLPAGRDIAVSCGAPRGDLGHLTAKLLAPLSPDTVSHVMAALVTHLGLAELRGAARCLHQKRLSRNALPASEVCSTGSRPTTPSQSLAAAARRLPRRLSLRPPLQRPVPARRNLRFATA